MPSVRLREWQTLTPANDGALAGWSFGSDQRARTLAEQLSAAGRVTLTELRRGLQIETNAWVGRVQIGDLHLTITPKLPIDVLLTLFRYAYQLRDLHLLPTAATGTESDAFQDLLIAQLSAEVSELAARGLHRQYQRQAADRAVPVGRIDLATLARRGGVFSAELPVIHHPRREDMLINQVLLAGLRFAVGQTRDLTLRARLRRLAGLLALDVTAVPLTHDLLTRAQTAQNRLTAAYVPALTLIALLFSGTGITLEPDTPPVRLPGFLFDMNQFFERLVGRFLHDHLPDCMVESQHRLTGLFSYAPDANPQRRSAPIPRPDFAVQQNGHLLALLDAKYRDLWERSLPREMLYQLAVYAFSQGTGGRAIILYPTLTPTAQRQTIVIQPPRWPTGPAHIILQPIDLLHLSTLLATGSSSARVALAQHWLGD